MSHKSICGADGISAIPAIFLVNILLSPGSWKGQFVFLIGVSAFGFKTQHGIEELMGEENERHTFRSSLMPIEATR